MELLIASAIGLLTAGGVYLLLQAQSFTMVLGLTLISYAVNLFIFVMGRLTPGAPPLISPQAVAYADPLPQALVLTAIVIGFAMTALFLVVLLASRGLTGTDCPTERECRPACCGMSRRVEGVGQAGDASRTACDTSSRSG